jgi:hypothetical protein
MLERHRHFAHQADEACHRPDRGVAGNALHLAREIEILALHGDFHPLPLILR